MQIFFYCTKINELRAEKQQLEAELHLIIGAKRELAEKQSESSFLPQIIFVTPSGYRPAQKADLTRLGQTLANVNNLFWIIVEDSSTNSTFINDLLVRLNIKGVHLNALTPADKKAGISDPNWKFPRGIEQRNTALHWIRQNLRTLRTGVVYFGDDDNTYDWRLFDEMRTIQNVGVWPVGIVGGLLVETPFLDINANIRGFNAKWKPNRPFPFDMAGFAINISLIHAYPHAEFTYDSSRGYLEPNFLKFFYWNWKDLEPKAENCTKVYVWHTRTERTKLLPDELRKFITKSNLSSIQRDAIF